MLGQLISAPVAPFRAQGNAWYKAQEADRQLEQDEIARATMDFLGQKLGLPQGVDPSKFRQDQIQQSGLDTESQNRDVAKQTFDNQQLDRDEGRQSAANYVNQFTQGGQFADQFADNPLFQAELGGGANPQTADRLRQIGGVLDTRKYTDGRADLQREDQQQAAVDLVTQGFGNSTAQNQQDLTNRKVLADYADSLQRGQVTDAQGQRTAEAATVASAIEGMLKLPEGTIPPAMLDSAAGTSTLMQAIDMFMKQEDKVNEALSGDAAYAIQDMIRIQQAKDSQPSELGRWIDPRKSTMTEEIIKFISPVLNPLLK